MSGNNCTADSWENQEDLDEALGSDLTKLNVNAPVFIPNVNAPAFVPNFMKEPQSELLEPDPPPKPTGPDKMNSESWRRDPPSSNEPSPDEEKPASSLSSPSHTAQYDKSPSSDDRPTVDSWEEAADATTPSPDEEPRRKIPTSTKASKKAANNAVEEEKDDDIVADNKEPINVVFIGHVDAGKSTIGGQIMYLTGRVDKRTLEKYEREAKEKNRETWYLSWALDTNIEERDKGKTVEVGRAYFETETKHFTILDAPGHKSFVPNMIGGACQADLAVLVISARKGEFETGFERGGQTREHAMLAKTAGVKHLVVLVNKMDDPTVDWSETRYNECREKLIPYLKKQVGFNPNKDIVFMPCSGLYGSNLKDTIDPDLCPWYKGPTLIDYLNDMPSLTRNLDGPFMMPIVDRYNDRGTVVMGKVDSGNCRKGDTLVLMPNKGLVTIETLWREEDEVNQIFCGENVKARLRGVEEADVIAGFVLCHPDSPCKTGRIFDAKVVILEHKSIICAGYMAICHMHSVAEEVTVKLLICLLDRKTDEKTKIKPRFVKQDQVAIIRFTTTGVICMEAFKDYPQLGRFTLRDEGKTVAIGKVLKVVE